MGNALTTILVYLLFCIFLVISRKTAIFAPSLAGIFAGGAAGYLLRGPVAESMLPVLVGANVGAITGASMGFLLTKRKFIKKGDRKGKCT